MSRLLTEPVKVLLSFKSMRQGTEAQNAVIGAEATKGALFSHVNV